MTRCTCSIHSAFRWTDYIRPSIFLDDARFTTGASSGRTMSQITSASVDRITERTGRSPGTVFGISQDADRRSEAGIYDRRKKHSRGPYKTRA